MPRIPISERVGTISGDTSVSNFVGGQAASEKLKTIDKLGDTLVELGGSVENLRQVRETNKARDYAYETSHKDYTSMVSQEQLIKEQRQRDGKGVDGYSKEVAQSWDDKQNAALQNAPNQLAKDLYKQTVDNYQISSLHRADSWEKLQSSKITRDRDEQMSEQDANTLITSGNLDDYGLMVHTASEKINSDNVNYEPGEKAGELRKYNQTRAIGYFTHLSNAEDFKKGVDLLKSGEGPTKDLGPNKRGELLKYFESNIKQKAKKDFINIENSAEDFSYQSLHGKVNEAQFRSVYAQIASTPALDDMPDIRKRKLDELKATREAGYSVQEAVKLPTAEYGKLDVFKEDKNPSWNPEARAKIKYIAGKAINDIIEERQKDGLLSTTKSSEKVKMLADKSYNSPADMEAFLSEAESEAQRTGAKFRTTTKSQSDGIGSAISQAAKSPEVDVLKVTLDKFINTYGKRAGQMLSEVAIDNKDLKGVYVLAQVDTAESRRSVLDNIKNGKANMEAFKDRFGDAASKELEMLAAIASQGFTDAVNTQNTSEFSSGSAIQEQVVLEASKLSLSDPNLAPKKAIAIAKQTIIDNNYVVTTGGKSNIAFPKNAMKVEKQTMDDFLARSVSPGYIKQFDPYMPDRNQDLHMNAITTNARWTLSHDSQYLELKAKGTDGISRAVPANAGQMPDGTPMYKPIRLKVSSVPDELVKINLHELVEINLLHFSPGSNSPLLQKKVVE